MITISVKTLDGLNRKFDVSGDLTIGQFKEFIANDVDIIATRQRIIYRGRVLQDDKVLNALDLDGKTLHLVEKAPNQTDDVQRNTVLPSRPVRHEISEQQIVIGSVMVPVSELNSARITESINRVLSRLGDIGRRATLTVNPTQNENSLEMTLVLRDDSPTEIESPAYARLKHVQHVLSHMDHMLYHLETDSGLSSEDGTSSEIQPDTTSSSTTPKNSASFATANDCDDAAERSATDAERSTTADVPESAADLAGVEPSDNTAAAADSQNTIREATVSYYATVFDEFQRIEQRLQPFTQQYLNLLRNEENYEQNPRDGQRTSRFFNNMQILLHNVSHVYHALSDLNIHFCRTPPRLVEPSVNRNSRTVIRAPEAQITMNFQRVNENDPTRANTTVGGTTGQFSTNQNQNQPRTTNLTPMQIPITGIGQFSTSGSGGGGQYQFTLSGDQLLGMSGGQSSSTPSGQSSTTGTSISGSGTTTRGTADGQAAASNGTQQQQQQANSFVQRLLSGILSGPNGGQRPPPSNAPSTTGGVPNNVRIPPPVTLSSGTPRFQTVVGPPAIGLGVTFSTSSTLGGQQQSGPRGPTFGGAGRGIRMTVGGQGTRPGQPQFPPSGFVLPVSIGGAAAPNTFMVGLDQRMFGNNVGQPGQGMGQGQGIGINLTGHGLGGPHNVPFPTAVQFSPQVLANSQQNLFSVDPFLPCSSRHFDPRNRPMTSSSASGAPTGPHDRTCEHNESRTRENAAGGGTGRGGPAESQAVDLNEFESTMEQLLRSVLESMRIHRGVPASTVTVETVSVEPMTPPTPQPPQLQPHPLSNVAAATAPLITSHSLTDPVTGQNVGEEITFTMVRSADPPNNVVTSNDTSATYRQQANENGPSANQTVPPAATNVARAESHDDDAWKENVPAEWVSVIEADIEKQKNTEVQRPFSDAYLNGMPLKRRKIICDAKPNLNATDSESTVRQLLQSSVADSAARTSRDQSPDEAVTSLTIDQPTVQSFEAALKEKIRQRAQCDPDFDEQRFTNVKKMLEK